MIAMIFSTWFIFLIVATICLRIWGEAKEAKEQRDYLERLEKRSDRD